MKLIQKSYLLLFVIGFGCNNRNTVHVYVENGSASQKELPVEVYVDDVLNRSVNVKKGTSTPRSKHIAILFPELKDSFSLKFRVANTREETECMIYRDSLTEGKWVSVILHETLLRKGWDIGGRVLTKDSIVEHSFSCGLVSQPICGFVEE